MLSGKKNSEGSLPERWLGLVVSGNRVTAVDVEVPDVGPLVLQHDQTWALQDGDRPAAYNIMFRRVHDYIRDNNIRKAIVKASAVSRGAVTKAHLDSAELRGVVMAAAASATAVELSAKAVISRTFGTRNADEYLSDSKFWDDSIDGDLRVGSREAALVLVASRGE